ncbi:MAG: HepT-like ribonuclease domain-containing protein [Terriglobia bacterium]
MKDDRVYLRHILECIRRIEEDCSGGRAPSLPLITLQDAVLRNLQTLGESAQRISTPLKDAYPKVEWRRITAFRNVLVHNYLGIDLPTVWDIVQEDTPRLKVAIGAALTSLESQEGEG